MSFYKYNFPSTIPLVSHNQCKEQGKPFMCNNSSLPEHFAILFKPMLLFYLEYYIFFESSKSLRNTLLLGILYIFCYQKTCNKSSEKYFVQYDSCFSNRTDTLRLIEHERLREQITCIYA